MDRDYKSLPFTNIKAESTGRIRTGIASVFGNVDAIGDRVMPGAFTRTIGGGAKRARFLWNHSYQHPPIASIKELREVSRDELPPEVIAKAPDATGGLLVKREYYDTELSNWILAAIDSGDVNEMSFAYQVVKSQMITEPMDGNADDTRDVCELQELKLLDCSDVLWGCNPATVTAGAKGLDVLPLGVLAAQFIAVAEDAKSGRRNSNSDQKLIEMMHQACVDLGAICPDPSDESEVEKSEPAEPISTSLSPNWLELQKAKTLVLALRNSIDL